jgi:hypothetical protein
MNPRYFVLFASNSHLSISSCSPAFFNHSSTWRMCCRCLVNDPLVKINTSLMYADANSSRRSRRVQFIYCWKVLGAFTMPKGVTSHSNRPNHVQKAVNHSSPRAIRILWKAAIISSFINHFTFKMRSRVSLIRGSGYQSFFIITFRA